MKISPDLTVNSLINDFSELFPGLKIELYTEGHKQGENSSPSSMIDHSMKLKEINENMKAGELQVLPDMTVADFENNFHDAFGINIQVFRRSNDLWLQTSATDSWTLEVQNPKGIHSVQS